jgi:type IV pilus assembly protein PilO
LSRIVTLNDIAINPAPVKGGGLIMDATARTYRYLDEEEVSQQRKAAAKGKPAAKK